MYPRNQMIGHTGTNGWAADDPSVGSAGWALVSHGIGEKLFTLNSDDVVVPSLATGVVKSGNDVRQLVSNKHALSLCCLFSLRGRCTRLRSGS